MESFHKENPFTKKLWSKIYKGSHWLLAYFDQEQKNSNSKNLAELYDIPQRMGR